MAYNEKIANITRELIAETHKNVTEKTMFGGLCFTVNDKMCVGVEKERLMIRLDPARYDEVMEKEGCKPMDFTSSYLAGSSRIISLSFSTPTHLIVHHKAKATEHSFFYHIFM